MIPTGPQTLTERQQRDELAGGDRKLAAQIKACQDAYDALGGRLSRAYETLTSMPASGLDEVRNGNATPAAERAIDLIWSFPAAVRDWLYGE